MTLVLAAIGSVEEKLFEIAVAPARSLGLSRFVARGKSFPPASTQKASVCPLLALSLVVPGAYLARLQCVDAGADSHGVI